MINLALHNIHRVKAKYRSHSRDNSTVELTFPESDANGIEINLFFGDNQRAALAFADAVNNSQTRAPAPIDEQE
jgi:hypothetical protein